VTVTVNGDQDDQIRNVERIRGTAGNDTIIGDAAGNMLWGGAGDDYIEGGAGNDTLLGEGGTDTISYATRTTGLSVNMGALS
ncbi:hypothetical protein QN405_26320, partial [Pseudomonas sp. AH2 (2023)]|nr:hypothetical protein [Pseudomonas sp. AH2 (2023)]